MRQLRPAAAPEASNPGTLRTFWGRPVPMLVTVPVLSMTLLGAPAGLVWSVLAPRPEMVLTSDGVVYANPEPHAPIAADGWFAVVTAAAGTLCGIVAYGLARRWLRTRAREVAALLGLTGGGLLASLVTWGVGRAAAFAEFQQQVRVEQSGARVLGFLQVHATGVLAAWPTFAVVTFALLLAVGARRNSRDRPYRG